MSEKEKEILKSINESISKMSDFDKGYILGMAESKAAEKREAKGLIRETRGSE